jgi:hypothetical protein
MAWISSRTNQTAAPGGGSLGIGNVFNFVGNRAFRNQCDLELLCHRDRLHYAIQHSNRRDGGLEQ